MASSPAIALTAPAAHNNTALLPTGGMMREQYAHNLWFIFALVVFLAITKFDTRF
jgi:hypothetical protein